MRCLLNQQNGVLKWRAFSNGEDVTQYAPGFFNDGATVTIQLEKNAQNKVEFRVNGNLVRTFSNPLNNVTNSARLIIASYQGTGYLPPLDAWQLSHNQVRAYQMQYKNSSNNWVYFTNSNKVTLDEWPVNVPTPDGKKYNLDKTYIGNADIYASLNKP